MKTFLIAVAALLLFSCSASKRSHQTRTDNSQKDSSVSYIDTSSKVVVEEFTEVTKIPADSVTITIVPEDLTLENKNIDTTASSSITLPKKPSIIVKETENLKVKVTVDKKGQVSQIQVIQKPQDVVKTSTKTTVERQGVTEKASVIDKKDTLIKEKERVPKTNWTLILVVIVVMIILGVLVYLKLPNIRGPVKKT